MNNKQLKRIKCCNCGSEKAYPIRYITGKQLIGTALEKKAQEDAKWVDEINNKGALMPEKVYLKRIKLDEKTLADKEIQEYIEGNKYKTPVDWKEITEYLCNECSENITPLVTGKYEKIINVMLIGKTGASKTATMACIFATVLSGIETDMECVMSEYTFEYQYYMSIYENLKNGIIPDQTESNENKYNTQPLIYIRVKNVLVIIHDYPGESFEKGEFGYNYENVVPVYLVDPLIGNEKEKEKQERILAGLVYSLNQRKEYMHEIIAVTKCDTIPEEANSIMLNEYNGTEEFGNIYAARRMNAADNSTETTKWIEVMLKRYCSNIDTVYYAALGCAAEANDDNELRLVAEYKPLYILDLIYTMAI